MFSFLRNLLALFGLIVLVGGGAAYYYYDSVDPCRVLAKVKSKDTIKDVSEAFGGDGTSVGTMDDVIEGTYRALVSQKSSGECAADLGDIWWDKIFNS